MVDDGCAWSSYIRPQEQDWQAMSRSLEDQILSYNETREKRCGG